LAIGLYNSLYYRTSRDNAYSYTVCHAINIEANFYYANGNNLTSVATGS